MPSVFSPKKNAPHKDGCKNRFYREVQIVKGATCMSKRQEETRAEVQEQNGDLVAKNCAYPKLEERSCFLCILTLPHFDSQRIGPLDDFF
jgi:hypothetical protein